MPRLRVHLREVHEIHQHDLADGFGSVVISPLDKR